MANCRKTTMFYIITWCRDRSRLNLQNGCAEARPAKSTCDHLEVPQAEKHRVPRGGITSSWSPFLQNQDRLFVVSWGESDPRAATYTRRNVTWNSKMTVSNRTSQNDPCQPSFFCWGFMVKICLTTGYPCIFSSLKSYFPIFSNIFLMKRYHQYPIRGAIPIFRPNPLKLLGQTVPSHIRTPCRPRAAPLVFGAQFGAAGDELRLKHHTESRVQSYSSWMCFFHQKPRITLDIDTSLMNPPRVVEKITAPCFLRAHRHEAVAVGQLGPQFCHACCFFGKPWKKGLKKGAKGW